jgi:signal transduction histidine kinase/CheY-like chemotaxis protein
MQKKDPLEITDRTDTPSVSHGVDEMSADTQTATSASAKLSPPVPVPEIYHDELGMSARSESSLMVQHRNLLQKNPHFFTLALFLFVVLCASGVSLTVVFGSARLDQERQEALMIAAETGDFFSSNLDDAILPLFSLAQFANELDIFKSLPAKVGMANQEGALPFMPSKLDQGVPTHRNITGVCDDPALVRKFDQIAGDIKKNARMDGILVNLQLVPDAVVCLAHPLNNTEDFPPGIYMDNSGAIGHDLLNDPARSFIARATVPAEEVVVAGPLTLRQCKDCDPVVEKGFIVRLPIASETNVITVDDVDYKRWGFAVAIINWNELVYRSDVFAMFEREDLEFQLTRTDRNFNPETGEFTEKVVVLAESSKFVNSTGRQVTAALPTTNNEWEITVKYCTEGCIKWFPWVIAITIILSLSMSVLVYLIFSQNQLHSNALAEKQEQMVNNSRLAARRERELNDFIAHEVRNPLSAALSATDFVSTSIHEKEPLLTEESRRAVREDVQIIESSLKFINDLLRSMLDLHRAKSNQLNLELAPTDIKRDILDPAASMLYQRDAMFSVEVHCPDNMLVKVDALRLKQIVLNLARNSCKFVERGFVRLRADFEGDGLVINIEDSGPGIPEEKRSQLFAQFQESLDSLSQGTGIGLSLCKKLVDLMGGTIKLDETYHSGLDGKPGAKLDIFVPCNRVSVDVLSTEFRHLPRNQSRGEISTSFVKEEEEDALPEEFRVLFVDDDVVLRKLFMRSLKRIRPKWSVMEAASGESALKLVETETFDVIFLDQYMTSVEKQLLGTETARKLRSMGVTSLICGLSANDMEEAFFTAGAEAFMMKPFPCKPAALTKELVRVLNRKDVECA